MSAHLGLLSRFTRRDERGSRWVHPDEHRIGKFFPSNPPERGDYVLVDGERHKVLRCPITWNGATWHMGERGIKVKPDPLPRESRQCDRLIRS